MRKKVKHTLDSWLIYGLISLLLLIPFYYDNLRSFFECLSISIFVGFVLSFMNDIYIELRKSNGEVFKNLED